MIVFLKLLQSIHFSLFCRLTLGVFESPVIVILVSQQNQEMTFFFRLGKTLCKTEKISKTLNSRCVNCLISNKASSLGIFFFLIFYKTSFNIASGGGHFCIQKTNAGSCDEAFGCHPHSTGGISFVKIFYKTSYNIAKGGGYARFLYIKPTTLIAPLFEK